MALPSRQLIVDQDVSFKDKGGTPYSAIDIKSLRLAVLAIANAILTDEIRLVPGDEALPQRFQFGSAIDAPDVFIGGQALSEAIGAFLALSGGEMTGDIAMADGKTVDGVDVSAFKTAFDTLAGAALLKSGGDMTGKVTTAATVAGAAGFNIRPSAVAPEAPVNGDMWPVGSALYIRLGGTTYQLAPTSYLGNYLPRAGGVLGGGLTVEGLSAPAASVAIYNPGNPGVQVTTTYRVIALVGASRTLPSDAVSVTHNPFANGAANMVSWDQVTGATGYVVIDQNGNQIAGSPFAADFAGAEDYGARSGAYAVPTYNETAVVRAARFIADQPQNTNSLLKVSVTGNATDPDPVKTLNADMSFGTCLRVTYSAGADVHIKVWADAAKTLLLYEAGDPARHQAGEVDAEPWGIFDVVDGDLYVEIANGTNVTVDFVIAKMG